MGNIQVPQHSARKRSEGFTMRRRREARFSRLTSRKRGETKRLGKDLFHHQNGCPIAASVGIVVSAHLIRQRCGLKIGHRKGRIAGLFKHFSTCHVALAVRASRALSISQDSAVPCLIDRGSIYRFVIRVVDREGDGGWWRTLSGANCLSAIRRQKSGPTPSHGV